MSLLLLFPDLGTPSDFSKNDRIWLDEGGNLVMPFGAIKTPTWDTNGRPSSPVEGMYGFNTALNQLEIYANSVWQRNEATGSTRTETTNYTVTSLDSVILADATSGVITITLPTAVSITGRKYTVKKINSNSNKVTVDGAGSETIDGATTQDIIFQYDAIQVVSDGSNWFVV